MGGRVVHHLTRRYANAIYKKGVKLKYIELDVKNALIFHGYDSENKPIEECIVEESFVRKLICVDRIRSISEQYLLVTGPDGREMYWEYKETLDEVKVKLQSIGVAVA